MTHTTITQLHVHDRFGLYSNVFLFQRVIRLPDSPTPSENSNGGEEGEAESNPAPEDGETDTMAPGYSVHPNSVLPPPDYQDALQDVLVVRGNDQTGPPDYTNVSDWQNGCACPLESV